MHHLHVLDNEFHFKPILKLRGWPDVITIFLRSLKKDWDGVLNAVIEYLCIVLFVYLVIPFLYKQNWVAVLKATFIPTLKFDKDFISVLVAILGTTISPYLFFWQATMEVEENRKKHLVVNKRIIHEMKQDVDFGMLFSNVTTIRLRNIVSMLRSLSMS